MFLAADPQADDLLDKGPFALLVGMLLASETAPARLGADRRHAHL